MSYPMKTNIFKNLRLFLVIQFAQYLTAFLFAFSYPSTTIFSYVAIMLREVLPKTSRSEE